MENGHNVGVVFFPFHDTKFDIAVRDKGDESCAQTCNFLRYRTIVPLEERGNPISQVRWRVNRGYLQNASIIWRYSDRSES